KPAAAGRRSGSRTTRQERPDRASDNGPHSDHHRPGHVTGQSPTFASHTPGGSDNRFVRTIWDDRWVTTTQMASGSDRPSQAERSRRAELGDFLKARRAGLQPEDVGLPPGPRRRTPGLRREEVALLAGVGVSWYTWLEQGRPINASWQVLDAVAR